MKFAYVWLFMPIDRNYIYGILPSVASVRQSLNRAPSESTEKKALPTLAPGVVIVDNSNQTVNFKKGE